jgi:flagellar biosynthetic protein FliR
MIAAPFLSWVAASLLFALRIGPLFLSAPPFTLVRLPATFRVLLSLGIAAAVMAGRADPLHGLSLEAGPLALASARELLLGLVFVVPFQLAFGAIYFAGRTVDIQGGFGLALLIDPTSRAQTPLIGTLFALLAGMLFFSFGGHEDVLRILAASTDAIPVGAASFPDSLGPLAAFLSTIFAAAFGMAGGLILSLFLVDLSIAALSRTVPQMNVLVLGFQVKTIVLLLALPATLALTATMLVHMLRLTIDALPRLA